MKLSRRDSVAAVLIGGTGLALMTGGTAYAYWTTTGSGTGQASATTAQAISADPTTVAAGLYPGASGVDGSVTVTNPNPFSVSATATVGSITVNAPHAAAGCTTDGLTVTPQSTPVPVGGNSTAELGFTTALSNQSPNACQGATFTINFSLTGTS